MACRIYHVGLSLLLMAGLFEFLCILFNNFSQVVHSKIHKLSSSCKVKYYLKTLMDQAGVEHNVFTSFKPCFFIILLYLSTVVCSCNTTFKYTLPAMWSLFKNLYLFRCICAKCEQMPTEPENVCCRKIPQVEFFVNGIVIMQSSSVLYSMILTLSIFKVTRRLLQLPNQPTCIIRDF